MTPSLSAKKSNLSLAETVEFLKSIKSHEVCVYAASGPNADRCNDFPDADVIGVNNTWKIMKRPPLAILTQFARYIEAMDPAFIPWVVCPSQVGTKSASPELAQKGHYTDPAECGFPAARMRTFEIREERGLDTGKMIDKLKRGQMPAMLRFGGVGTYGLILAALAGYLRIVCCGHDGGVGRHPLLHDSSEPKTKHHDLNLGRTRELAEGLVRAGLCKEIVFAQDL